MAARDILVIGALLFMFGLGFFILYFAVNNMVHALISNAEINESAAAVEAFQSMNIVTNRLDYMFFGIFIAIVLSTIITSFFVGANPIFAFMYILVIVLGVATSTVFANVWETVVNLPVFSSVIVATTFPMTNNILTNLPIYLSVIGVIGFVAMFTKPVFGGGQGGGEYA
jgi:hypothetical protein